MEIWCQLYLRRRCTIDAISYSYADKQAKNIKKIINDPDSTSGVITVPKVIASGENITVPAGRVAILPNVQVDGVLNVTGEVFVPSGATTADLDNRIGLKADTTYVDAQVATRCRLVQGTAQNSTSGTSIDFTGIPNWAKRITVMFNGVSTNGSSNLQIQIGNTTFQTTGYSSIAHTSSTASASTTGFIATYNNTSTYAFTGEYTIDLLSGFAYVGKGVMSNYVAIKCDISAGSVTLSGVLDRIRVTTANGTDTFDAGQINIMYEG